MDINPSRLSGTNVVGPDGERIGKVAEVHESSSPDRRGTFATVAAGLLGSGRHFFPLDDAELRDGELVVPYSKELVTSSPGVRDDRLTPEEEERLHAHYGMSGPVSSAETAVLAVPDADGSLVRSEERLHVGTERVEVGRARLRKRVVSETVTRTVPVSHEELRITREPIVDGPATTTPLSEEVHELVLTAEHPVVRREVVPVERVRLETVTVTEQETVVEELRREEIEVDSDVPVEGRTPPAPTP